MSKYPPLDFNSINNCINIISSKEFDTYEFIEKLRTINRTYFNLVSGIGSGWKSVIGKNLSNYATSTRNIKKKKRKGNAQLWVKR